MRADRKSSPRTDKKAPSRAHKRGNVGYSKKSALLEEAITQMNTGKYGRSSSALKELLALDPLNTEARRLFATLHVRLGSLMTARSAFESLAKEALQRQDCWLAESLLKEYLVAGPRCVSFIEMLAHVYEEKGDPMAAAAEYAKAIEILIEDGDPDNPNRPAELYAKIRELAPASPEAFRLAAQFDAATGKILRPSSMDILAESSLPPASQLVEGAGTPGETSGQSIPWERVEDSTTQPVPVALQGETERAAEAPASEVQNALSVGDPIMAETESRQQAGTGESESSQDARSQTTEVPSVSVGQAFQLAGYVDAVTSPPVLAVHIPAVPDPAVVNEPGSEEAYELAKVSEGVANFVESKATGAGVAEPLSEASSGPVSEAKPSADVLEFESEFQLASEPRVAQLPISAPMPWEQVEEASVFIPQSEPQAASPCVVELETPLLPEGVCTEVTSDSVTQSAASSAAAVDQTIEQQGGATPETADTVTVPLQAEEPRLSVPADSKLSAFSWEEILGRLSLSSRKSPSPATPQAEPTQRHESLPPPSPSPIIDEKGASQPHDATARIDEEPLTPLVAIPSRDEEGSQGDPSASSALSIPMPWEQVEETSVSIPQSEPEPIEVQPAEPEEAVVSSPESLDRSSLAEHMARHATTAETSASEIRQPPVDLVQAGPAIEASPTQSEPEFYLAVADAQPSETLVSREVSPTGSEPVVATESDSLWGPVADQQDTAISLDPEPPRFSILPKPTVEELRPIPSPVQAVSQEIASPVPALVHEEVHPETGKTVPAETEIALAPPAVTEQVESPIVSSPAPHHPGSQEEHISQASEEPITLKLHLPHAVPVREEVSIEDAPWLRLPEPEPESLAVALEPAPIPVRTPTPKLVEAANAPSTITMTSAVDVLFERTEKLAPVSTHDKTATVKLKTRRTLPFARARMGVVFFVRNCVSTTRSILVTLLGLVGLSIAGTIVCVGATGLLWVAMEERPNNSSHNLTTRPQHNISDPKKNGYLLLLGIDATPARDPLQAGYERKFEETDRDTLRVCLTGNDGRATTGSASSQVLSGWLRAADPAAQFKIQASGVKTWLAQSDVTLGRYRQWLKMPFEDWGYGESIVPNCQQIVSVHRLFLAEGFAQDLDSGMDRLEADMTAWRTVLAQARTLAVKMMAVEAITDDMAVASGLLIRPDLDPKHVPRLLKMMRPLDQVEQSIRWPMQGQFVLATKTLDSDLRRDKADERPWYVSVTAAMPLPKQRRFNAYADYYEASSKTSAEARPTSIPKLSTYIRAPATGWLDYLLNPIEHLVGVEPLPRWEDYSERILETDARLRLVSLQAWVRKGSSEGELATRIAKAGQQFYDPFTGLPMLINSKKGVIFSVGHDGKDQDGDPTFDVAVPIPPFPTTTSPDTKRNVPVKAQ